MPVNFADLIVPSTREEALAVLLAILSGGDVPFPVTSWQPGSVPLSILEAFSQVHADQTDLVAKIALGGTRDTAEGAWLTLLARSAYGLERLPATSTVGLAPLADGGAGPHTIVAGQLIAVSTTGLYYRNTTGGVLPQNGSLTLSWKAEGPGAKYNVANNTIVSLATPLPTVTISNPAGVSGTWITTQGRDEEIDAALGIRCEARWPELGTGATALVYKKWALEASDEVTRVFVRQNPVTAGIVEVVVAGPDGAISAPELAAVDAYLQDPNRKPLTDRVEVSNAVNHLIDVTATLKRQAAYHVSDAATLVEASAALEAFVEAQDMGATIYVSALVEVLMALPGMVDAVVTLPAAAVVLPLTDVAVLDEVALTTIPV